ncbi:uncharacterized protein LOC144865631 [Branchiostoma floridae x Branchiostoma japonicum]
MSRHQELICGLSHVVTIAVLPRLKVEELMFELNRRIQNLDKENSIKDRLVCILRDVMLEEYRQLERKSEVSYPDDTAIPVQNQENVLTAPAETILSETSSPDASQQGSELNIVIKKENDLSTQISMQTTELELDTDNVHLAVPQKDQLCNMPSPGSPTLPPCNTPPIHMNNTTDSRIKEEDFAMGTEDEAGRPRHDEFSFDTPTSSTQVLHALDTRNPMNTYYTEKPVERDTACEETPPDHGDIHVKMERHVSQGSQIRQIFQTFNPDQPENYADERVTDFTNTGHEYSRKDNSEETPLASYQRTPDQDCESMASLRSDDNSQIGSKRSMSELETSFINSSSKHRKRNKGDKPFMCGECGYRACDQRRLVEHMGTHTGEKPFKCNHCNYKSSFRNKLVEHMKRHTGEEPYSCELCDYQAYRKSHIERHMMRHSGVKPYKCEECDYRTAQKANLTRHRRQHTGERPYSCQECDYKTTDRSTLAKHMRSKHQ